MINENLFSPGLPLSIELPFLEKIRCASFFRGCKEYHYILIDHPVHNGLPVLLENNKPCVVRFIYEGNVFGFSGHIISAIRQPFPLVFLTYPHQLESLNLRTNPRYPVRIEATYTYQTPEGSAPGIGTGLIVNISEGGCLLEVEDSIDPGNRLTLSFTIPPQETVQELEVEVKRVKKGGEHAHLGLTFITPSESNTRKINEYLAHMKSLRISP
jgi:c-di-GMP-binding flagellar brake protein YcgR